MVLANASASAIGGFILLRQGGEATPLKAEVDSAVTVLVVVERPVDREATPLEAEGSRIATSRGCCLCSHVLAAAVATPAATRTPPLARFVQTATSERESKDRAAEAASA